MQENNLLAEGMICFGVEKGFLGIERRTGPHMAGGRLYGGQS